MTTRSRATLVLFAICLDTLVAGVAAMALGRSPWLWAGIGLCVGLSAQTFLILVIAKLRDSSATTRSPVPGGICMLALAGSRAKLSVWESVLLAWEVPYFTRNVSPLAYLLGPLPYDLSTYELYVLDSDFSLAADLLAPSLAAPAVEGELLGAQVFSTAWLINIFGPFVISSVATAAGDLVFNVGGR